MVNEFKSLLSPNRRLEWLGVTWDSSQVHFSLPFDKISSFRQGSEDAFALPFHISQGSGRDVRQTPVSVFDRPGGAVSVKDPKLVPQLFQSFRWKGPSIHFLSCS